MTTTTHTIISELTSNPKEFTGINRWIAEKIGEDRASEMTAGSGDGENSSEEFSYFYDAWMHDQKIVHTVEQDGNLTRVTSYKDITPERVQECLAKLI
jgi:hypothetical protein